MPCWRRSSSFPKQHRSGEIGRRRFAVLDRFPFAVPYQIKREEIVIPALAHTSRRPGYWSRRR
jgi:hypothetical protein